MGKPEGTINILKNRFDDFWDTKNPLDFFV